MFVIYCGLVGYTLDFSSFFCVSGRNPAVTPSSGRKALTWNMNSMLVRSASHPKNADPRPPRPNISPKKMPAISPTLSGIRSVAYTTMDENADAMISPERNVQTIVSVKLA